ncbi:GntP family gluconate:H+ symporter [Dyadobacter jejuensis]|uniref:GntP family gluconate:H+ symporter n=1 Tax=Dyadobacter jejuensis TaxID=1082580 RepID=A0A316AP21_9BACT|nr:GntP family permease [Dyadobacter jejuensis]PWJ59228.1 GntP family gluconate:H+ symporter [Dyadobacter jejuensis]
MIIIIVFIAIAFIVLSSTVLRMHPLVGLILAALGVGIAAGLPVDKLAETIGKGFGDLMSKIGMMVILGCVIGSILDRSGAAVKVADVILKLFGARRPAFAMAVIGAVVGIPVFCDSGFIILHKLNRIVAERTGKSLGTIAMALSGGLFATHTLVPPTPGPISAAGNLGIPHSMGIIILLGLLVSIPNLFVSAWFAEKYGSRVVEGADQDLGAHSGEHPTLPPAWKAFMPIVLPIFLITLASIGHLLEFPPVVSQWLGFLGSPLVSFLIAIFFSYSLFSKDRSGAMIACFKDGISHCGTTLVLVGAGGAFGAVLKETELKYLVSDWLAHNEMSGLAMLLIAFVIAAFFKTAQGSTTTSMVLTTSILAPLLLSMGFVTPLQIGLMVMAVGSGSMTVSHSNDAWFWVVSQFTGITPSSTYRTHTLLTGLQGLVSLVVTLFLYFVLVGVLDL